MNVEQLKQRANHHCELCSGSNNLKAFHVTPSDANDENHWLLVCQQCGERLAGNDAIPSAEMRFLADRMWSELPVVQVACYRLLKRMAGDAWAENLLGQLYLDDELLKWADAASPAEASEDRARTLDSNGTQLAQGDSVTLIKDLDVKGANFTAKRGTLVKNITLTDDPKYVEGRVNGTQIVLVAAYLKKA